MIYRIAQPRRAEGSPAMHTDQAAPNRADEANPYRAAQRQI